MGTDGDDAVHARVCSEGLMGGSGGPGTPRAEACGGCSSSAPGFRLGAGFNSSSSFTLAASFWLADIED